MKTVLGVVALLIVCVLITLAQTAPQPSVTLSGIVINRAGQPVPNATLQVSPAGPIAPANTTDLNAVRQAMVERSRSVQTGADGKFIADGLPPGQYRIRITHPAYVPLTAGPDALGAPSNLSFTLVNGAVVTGRIVDADGDPLPRLRVEVSSPVYYYGRRRFQAVSTSPTNDNGEFKITGIPPGKYYVKASGTSNRTLDERAPIPTVKPGQKDIRQFCVFYGATTQLEEALLLPLAAGQEFSVGDMTMLNKPYIHVRGKVIGDPALLAGARVVRMGWEPGSGPDWTGGADIQPDGTFDKANMWPDAFTLGVYKREGGLLGWAAINTNDEDMDGVVINATAAPLTGSVRIEGDVPHPRATLQLTASEGPSIITSRAQITTEGAFNIPFLGPGKYIAEIAGLPAGWYIKSMHLEGREALDNGIDFAGGGAKLDILLSPKAAAISGAVTDKEGNPLKAKVTLVPETPRPGHARLYPATTTAEDGTFKLESITPGRYRIYAWEEILDTAHWDEAYMQPFRTSGERIELKESEHASVSLTRISESTMREALSRAGL